MYGVNYAWAEFGGDFGGISAWNLRGVSQNRSRHMSNLTDMRQNGVDTIRWWVFPESRGEGVRFDGSGSPTGLGGTAVADIQAALEIAAQVGVHIQLCLLSFDNFRPTRTEENLPIPGIQPIIISDSQRAALMTNVVRVVARTVAQHANRDRVVSWDVINEPEWAMSGTNPYGDMAYTPTSGLQAVTHAQMERFVSDTIAALRAEHNVPITVGGAAIKWAKAWSRVPVDFYTFHMYGWVHMYFPYNRALSQYGVTDKPVLMGEFPLEGLPEAGASYSKFVTDIFNLGYAGALPWQFADTSNWNGAKANVKAWGDANACITRY
jgi:hypothetical protein